MSKFAMGTTSTLFLLVPLSDDERAIGEMVGNSDAIVEVVYDVSLGECEGVSDGKLDIVTGAMVGEFVGFLFSFIAIHSLHTGSFIPCLSLHSCEINVGELVGELVGEAVVGEAVVGDAVIGEAVVGDAFVGDAVVGDAVVGFIVG